MSDETLVITAGTVKGPVMDADGRNVIVSGNGCVVELSGQCGEIKVIGNDHEIKAQAAESINLLGNGNSIVVGTLGAARFNGADNALTWSRATNGKAPSFALNGEGNSVSMAPAD